MRNGVHKIFVPVVFFLSLILGLAASSSAQQNLTIFSCTPAQVGSFNSYNFGTPITGRVWVQCIPPLPFPGQLFFAVPLTDAAEAARFLSLFTAAFVAGKTIDIGYNPSDLSGQTFSCTTTTNCFPAVSATIR